MALGYNVEYRARNFREAAKPARGPRPIPESPCLPVAAPLVETATTAASATAARSGESGAGRTRFVHGQRAAGESLAVQRLDGALKVFTFRQFYEAEAFRFARHLVVNDHRRCDAEARLGDEVRQLAVGNAAGEIAYKQL